jgi:hypothetical protein
MKNKELNIISWCFEKHWNALARNVKLTMSDNQVLQEVG